MNIHNNFTNVGFQVEHHVCFIGVNQRLVISFQKQKLNVFNLTILEVYYAKLYDQRRFSSISRLKRALSDEFRHHSYNTLMP